MSRGPRLFGSAAQGEDEQAHEATIFGHFAPVMVRSLTPGDGVTGSMVAANGLVDTGASDICIDVRLADHLRCR